MERYMRINKAQVYKRRMKTGWITLFVLAGLLTGLQRATLGQSLSKKGGTRVKLSAPGVAQNYLTGYARWYQEYLVLHTSDSSYIIPYQAVNYFAVAVKGPRQTGMGALTGSLIGGFGLGIIAAATNDPNSDNIFTLNSGEAFGVGFASGAVLGAVAGAIIGSSVRVERWEPKSIDAFRPYKPVVVIKKPIKTSAITNIKPPVTRKSDHWMISMVLGGAGKGPTGVLEDRMRDVGLGDFQPKSCALFFCSTEQNYPSSSRDGTAITLDVRYRFRKSLWTGLNYSNYNYWETQGYNSKFGSMRIQTSLMSFSPIFSVQAENAINLGVGPALHFATSDLYGDEDGAMSKTKLGAMVDFSLTLPAHTLFYLVGEFQYKWVGKVDVGPFTRQNFDDVEYTFPGTHVNFNHGLWALGLGMRF